MCRQESCTWRIALHHTLLHIVLTIVAHCFKAMSLPVQWRVTTVYQLQHKLLGCSAEHPSILTSRFKYITVQEDQLENMFDTYNIFASKSGSG
jgi:hypothetical protein